MTRSILALTPFVPVHACWNRLVVVAPGFPPRALALAASFFAGGGIGLYDDFTHLDVWKVRTWTGPPHHDAHAPAPGVAMPKPAPATAAG